MKRFQFTCSAFQDDSLVSMPGFSHRSQPFKVRVCWYPFEEWFIKAWVYARNRRHAVKQLERNGIANVRDLDEGKLDKNCPKAFANL
jgi:hypothetical protein